MYLATAAAILLLANAAYVHARCDVTPDPTTGAVVIPANWTEIPELAFAECETITSVVIPTNIINTRKFAFVKSQLKEIVFENGSQLHTIGNAVFYETMIKKIEIPKSVKTIDIQAFQLSQLEEVKFENGSKLENIYFLAFKSTQLRTINIPAGVLVGGSAFQDTPCPDNTIFRPGAIIVNCTIVTHAPSSVPTEISSSPPTHASSGVPSEISSSPHMHATSPPSMITLKDSKKTKKFKFKKGKRATKKGKAKKINS